MPRLGAKVCLLRCTLLSSLLLLLVCSIHETEQNSYCQQIITEKHLAELEELADTQMQHPGRVSFKFINKMQLKDSVCYVKAAFPLLGKILERTEFKENSSNAKKMQTVRRMYSRIDENIDPCIKEEDDEERKLSQMCFEEFTTSPYEMLVLVKQFFQDINQLLQNQETFEKDCSQVYRRTCLGPRKAGSSPGVGTAPDCNCLSPALPSATQPSPSAAARASSEAPPALARVGLLHADSHAPSQPPGSTEGGSGTEEVPGAGAGAAAPGPSPGMRRRAPALGTGTLAAAAGPVPRGDRELREGATEEAASEAAGPRGASVPPRGASVPPARPRGLSTTPPAAAPARIRPAGAREPVTQLRVSRMAPAPWHGPGLPGWGLSRTREPEDAGAGPSFDSGFVLSAEQRRKEPAASEGRREPLVYMAVASVVAVLLAVGGLLFYKYRPRVLERPLEDGGCEPQEPERRALQEARGCPELETQDL
ncbi:macrophage colony-stimulating factor 1 isoform X1 [Colius striatus]|uniref:macrophage colony-stimulating factor 1 isoform X1 n=1 Tax=Colius striatus TaxID=57412 RepID=UPI002B1E29FC|nr:macrophage colony-stimulating factor 1 isoform X1 [Colius striatus]